MSFRRVYLIVLDGLGVGNAPDAAAYGDSGSDTLGHIAAMHPHEYAALAKMGLGNLYPDGLPGLQLEQLPSASYGRLTEVSAGKDTTTGHWEMMGIVRDHPAPTFPDGFPADLLRQFSEAVGRGVIGNRAASGTQIIQELGAEHIDTGALIVYTSADSVFQIAAHTEIVDLTELYAACKVARSLLTGDLAVDRVIARPFVGSPVRGFVRTIDRRDFSLPPPDQNYLFELKAAGCDVIGLGKIRDIFAGRGLTASMAAHGNIELMSTLDTLASDKGWGGLVFANLVDFDMLYGHRNNPLGYAEALMEFDHWLGGFTAQLELEDLLIITADHGNDPTTESTDHSREQVPVLLFAGNRPGYLGKEILAEPGFFHVGRTVIEGLGLGSDLPGLSLINLEEI